MTGKTANVIARVEPQTKEQAEAILSQLGIPTSVVINMLYKQIILHKGIPFSLNLTAEPATKDSLNDDAFAGMMSRGLSEAKADRSLPATEVFAALRKELR